MEKLDSLNDKLFPTWSKEPNLLCWTYSLVTSEVVNGRNSIWNLGFSWCRTSFYKYRQNLQSRLDTVMFFIFKDNVTLFLDTSGYTENRIGNVLAIYWMIFKSKISVISIFMESLRFIRGAFTHFVGKPYWSRHYSGFWGA